MEFAQVSTRMTEVRAGAYLHSQTAADRAAGESLRSKGHSGADGYEKPVGASGPVDTSQTKWGPAIASSTPGAVAIGEMKDEVGVARSLAYVGLETVDGAKEVPLAGVFADFDKEKDVIIGIDVNGNTQGHMYLIVDGVRIDGRMFFKGHDECADPQIAKGLAIRYRNVPESNMAGLREFVRSDEELRSPSCVATACKLLYRKAELHSGPDLPKHWFPGPFLRNLANHGLVGDNGRLTAEIYTIDSEIEGIWNNLPTWKGAWRFLVPVFKATFFGGYKKSDG